MLDSFYNQPFPQIAINDKLILREQLPQDAEAFFRYYSNPVVGQYILAAKPRTLSEANSEIQYCNSLFKYKKGIYWTIADRQMDTMLGAIGIYINNFHCRGEICFDLAPECWNKGVMTLALNRVVQFAFKQIGLVRVEATVLKENRGSVALLKKCGFKCEGTLKKYRQYNQKFYDVDIYSTIASSADINLHRKQTRPAAVA